VAGDHGQPWSTDFIAALVARKAARMEVLEADESVLFPGARATVERVAAKLPVAIASGALGSEIRRVLDAANLTSFFRAIVSAGDTAASKPAPDPYLRAVSLLSRAINEPLEPGDCVAVEDSRWGLASAKAAGLKTVGVAHTYDATELGTADLVIGSLDRLDLDALARLYEP